MLDKKKMPLKSDWPHVGSVLVTCFPKQIEGKFEWVVTDRFNRMWTMWGAEVNPKTGEILKENKEEKTLPWEEENDNSSRNVQKSRGRSKKDA